MLGFARAREWVFVVFVAVVIGGIAGAGRPRMIAASEPPDVNGGVEVATVPGWEPGESNVYIPEAPAGFAFDGSGAPLAQVSITVNYLNAWPADAVTALERAVTIWESVLVGNGPITVDATWGGTTALGTGGPSFSSAAGIWRPAALANQLCSCNASLSADINLKMNPSPPQAWWYGAGQAPVGTIDFTTVALHELGHGLGHTDSFAVTGANGSFGLGNPLAATLWDTFAVTAANVALVSLGNNTPALMTALQSNNVFFNGPLATAANGGIKPKLYAPTTFSGSSISHLDETTYNNTPNRLMTPVVNGNETVRDPGPIFRGMLKDLGYTVADLPVTPGTVQFLQTANSGAESVGSINVPVTRTSGSAGAASVQCQVDTGGTAATPADYTITTGTLNWNAGETGTKNCVVAIVNDTAPEQNESIALKLAAQSGAALGTITTTSITILANDQPGTLAFASTTASAQEGGPATSLSVARTAGTDGAIGATCVVTGGTAQPADYTLASTTLAWPAGSTQNQSCSITAINNPNANGNKTVIVAIQSPTGAPAPAIGTNASITVTLIDDDAAGTLEFLAADLGGVFEGQGAFAFSVKRVGSFDGAVSATCAVVPGNSTMIPVLDYTMTNATVSWTDGESGTKDCTVSIVDDNVVLEGDEILTLRLAASSGATIGAISVATLTTWDNDPPLLKFANQPGNGIAGAALFQQPVVEIQDEFGDLLDAVSAVITLELIQTAGLNHPPATLFCSVNPLPSNGGVSPFEGCLVGSAAGGVTLRLKASGPLMSTAVSEPFTIIDPGLDANCSGDTDALDALAALRALAGFSEGLRPVAPCTGDANDVNGLEIRDVLLIRQFVAAPLR